MFGSTVAQIRYATAIGRGRPIPLSALRSLFVAALRTAEQRGVVAASVDALLADDTADLDLTRRRFARQVRYATTHTRAYNGLSAQYGDHRTMSNSVDDLPAFTDIPVTTKHDIAARPADFVAAGADTTAVSFTTGSSGTPTPILFSRSELTTSFMLTALADVVHGHVQPGDGVFVAHGTRIGLSNSCTAMAAGYIGAQVTVGAQPSPTRLMSMMNTAPTPTTVLYLHPSYLGHLITLIQNGNATPPTSLRRVVVGGEVATDGALRRARAVFGPAVEFLQGYGMTETWPAAGSMCEAGHMHVEASRAVVEVMALDSPRRAEVGELGTLVVTPLLPFRSTTPFIRYNTEDVVRVVEQPTSCSMAAMPGTSVPFGRLGFSLRLTNRWITPRDILEVVEADPNVPLPSRVSYRRNGQRVDIDVQALCTNDRAHRTLREAFEAVGVPVSSLQLHAVGNPIPRTCYPWRGDLWEPELTADFDPDPTS